MKIKIKNFVFAGFAAAMFAGSAMANEGDLNPTVNPDRVTAKSYVDRVVLNHTNNGDIHVTAAQKTEWSGKQDAISDLSTIRSGAAAGATAVQPAAITNMEETTHKQTTGLITANETTHAITSVAAGSATDYASTSAISSDLTKVKAAIEAAQSAATYDDTELAGRVLEAEADIDRLETNAEIKSNKAANLADVIDASDLANKYPNVGAVKNALADKQDKDDSTVANGTYNYITQGSGVATNLVNLDTQVKSNADAIATKASSSDLTTLAGRVTTAEGDIDALESGKQDKSDSTVANGTYNYIQQGSGVATNLVNLDTQVKSNADAIAGNTSAITTLQGQAANISGKQDKSTANYQMGNSSGTWTAMTTAQQNALNSGIFATTCDENTPCVFVNDQWVQIQQ